MDNIALFLVEFHLGDEGGHDSGRPSFKYLRNYYSKRLGRILNRKAICLCYLIADRKRNGGKKKETNEKGWVMGKVRAGACLPRNVVYMSLPAFRPV